MTQLENKSPKDDLKKSQEDSQPSTNLNSKANLIHRLRKGRHVRTRFVESHLDKKLAFQIRALRGDASQEKIEEITGIKQQALSRLESPYYGKATLTTLKKIAAVYDVGLLVEFVPFSQLVNRVSGTPYVERGFSPETMNLPSFEEEEKERAFDSREGVPARHSFCEDEIGKVEWQKGSDTGMRFELPPIPQGKKPPLPFPNPNRIGFGPEESQIRMGGSK